MSIPFQITDWSKVPSTEHPGEQGLATWRTLQLEGVRVRMVDYSAGYKADHWCAKGHIIFCIQGEMTTTLKDGNTHILKQGMSYQVSDDAANPHSSESQCGCRLFIVDGPFLGV